jgi:hypothetical protein
MHPTTLNFGIVTLQVSAVLILDRAWVAVGSAVRLALACGLHTRLHYSMIEPKQEQIMADTWWGLYNLESLLSSMTGRLSMLHNEHVTTPLPSAVAEQSRDKTALAILPAYSDAQIHLANISQEALFNLYTERRTPRSWPQIHAIMTSMQSDLDNWAQEAIPDPPQGLQASSVPDAQYMMLKKQCYRVRIMITRPSLRRIERCSETAAEDFTLTDQDFANTCIQTAQDLASLLPDDAIPHVIYENGPWWTIVHNSTSFSVSIPHTPHTYHTRITSHTDLHTVTQSLSILLTSVSLRPYFQTSYTSSLTSIRKLITHLYAIRDTNDTARRAYNVVCGIVKSRNTDRDVWKDVVDMFPEEDAPTFRPRVNPNTYLEWEGAQGRADAGAGVEGGMT